VEQKLGSANKANLSYGNSAIAFKKQSDKQLEQLRKYEEIQQNIAQQLHYLEKSSSKKQLEIEFEKQKNGDMNARMTEAFEALKQSNLKSENVFQIDFRLYYN
jgi:transposase